MNFESFVRPAIAGLDPYKPGVYYTALAQRQGLDPLDIVKLDANENVYGPSPKALEALRTLSDVHIYPELQNQCLRDALADFTGVSADLLLAGAGSDELLALTTRLLLQPGDTVVNCPPTFGMYAFFANLAGARVLSVPRLADFSLDLDAIKATVTKEHPKLLFICA
ncbi:MAG: aminotransferase class I/II-fold pyridoxal phosphate-dependent enzyme, partial [Anaerolineae bacterium]|nr:aminotransferase class I/II-fold pyridoxal phosphate-dependent enzyme [Anaerolineae bacterium]